MRRRRRRRDHRQPHRRRRTSGQAGHGQGAAADRRRAGRRAASEGRRLRPAPLRHPASRRRSGPVRGGEDRPGPGRARRPAPARALPGPERPGLDGERAGPALARLRARLPEVGAPVRRLHRHRRRHAGGRVPPLRIGSAGRRPAERSRGPERGPAVRQPQRRPPALRPGRGAPGQPGGATCCTSGSATAAPRTTRTETARTSRRCSARSCGSIRAPRAAAPTRSRTPTRSSGRSGARPEIYSYGLRNPWRFSFDRRDRGARDRRRGAERDRGGRPGGAGRGPRGRTSAGRPTRGSTASTTTSRRPDALPPVLVYGHDAGCSITGGYVVRDRGLRSLYGRYLYGDFCAGRAAQLRRHARSAAPPTTARWASRSRR